MAVRDQVVALAGREVFIQGVMVFPKARVNAKFGTTRTVKCMREGQLCKHIEDERFAKKLTAGEIDLFTRAFQGIAGMDSEFRSAPYPSPRSAEVKRSSSAASAAIPALKAGT